MRFVQGLHARHDERLVALAFACAIGLAGCSSRSPEPPTQPPDFRTRQTVAVLDFESSSPVATPRSSWLGLWLADRVIAQFDSDDPLVLVDRRELDAILREQTLGSSALTEARARIQLGKSLGAQSLILGSFMEIGSQIRLDASVVDVETGLVAQSASATGEVERVRELAAQLARSLTRDLPLRLNQKTARATGADAGDVLEAEAHYAAGRAAERRGEIEAAIDAYQQALELAPTHRLAERRLRALLI